MRIAMDPKSFHEVMGSYYNSDIQFSASKIELVAGAIANRSPNCALLVFGLGNDSPLWHHLNAGGRTLFVENSPEWIEKVLEKHPYLDVMEHSYTGSSVRRSLRSPVKAIRAAGTPPEEIRNTEWDVIVIDAPGGNRLHRPGRAWPIAWAAQIAKASTHVFVDDYNRQLEKIFSEFLLLSGRPNHVTLAPEGSKSHLLYSIGNIRTAALSSDNSKTSV
jgi:hypothetical protein